SAGGGGSQGVPVQLTDRESPGATPACFSPCADSPNAVQFSGSFALLAWSPVAEDRFGTDSGRLEVVAGTGLHAPYSRHSSISGQYRIDPLGADWRVSCNCPSR